MVQLTASIRPFLLHPHQAWKWVITVALAVAAWWMAPGGWWWLLPVGFALFFPQEYLFHRGIFHHFAGKPLGRVLSSSHVAHHRDPREVDLLWVPPSLAIPTGGFYLVLYLVLAWGIGAANPLGIALTLSVGNFLGLQAYEWFHFQAHRPTRPWTPWGRLIKRIHLLHHYKNERFWYGVTWGGVLGDLLFGTWRRAEDVETSDSVRDLGIPEDTWGE